MTDQDYGSLVKQLSSPSPMLRNTALAFAVGGAICAFGQICSICYTSLGLNGQQSGTCVTITLILISVLLTGWNLYDKIAKHAGAGTLVPVTGFANSIAAPAMDFKTEGYVTGMAAKMFTIAGPVLVFGLGSSVVYGIMLWITRFLQ